MVILADSNVNDASFAVEETANRARDNLDKMRIIGIFVIFVLLEKGFRFVYEFVVVEIGTAAEIVAGSLGIFDLFYAAVELELDCCAFGFGEG
jgi:hypothetical protein